MNTVDLNLDVINLVKGIPDDSVVFYFLSGEDDDRDFLYAKGDLDVMAASLANLMEENEGVEYLIREAIKEFQHNKL